MMTDDDKRLVDSLLALAERSWGQFNERRRYELQLSFAIWTALALAIAGSVQLAALPDIPFGRYALVGLVTFAIALHVNWQIGIRRANRRDFQRVKDYQSRILAIAGFEYSNETQKRLNAGERENEGAMHWSIATQLGFTFFLGLCLLIVNWKRFDERVDPSPQRQLAHTRDSLAIATDRLRLHMLQLDSASRLDSEQRPKEKRSPTARK